MDLHHMSRSINATMAKRLWSVLRVTFFMIRKGLVSKRKLIMDMNLMMKRGKLLRKTMTNLIFNHRHVAAARSSYGQYEFSCSNSPNPVFFRALKRKRALNNYFPCINPPRVIEEDEDEWNPNLMMVVKTTPENYYPRSPLLVSPSALSFSSEDEDGNGDNGRNGRIDDEAEEFIRRFYQQLRTQSRTQLLQYDQED